MCIKFLRQILVSLYITTSAVINGEVNLYGTKFLNEADCGNDETFCDLISLSKGFKIVEINSSGTHWKVLENQTCNIEQLTFLEPATIDESIVKTCNIQAIFFTGFNYDCNIDLWVRVLKFVSWNATYMAAEGTNCSSLGKFDKECGNKTNFLHQILCMESMIKFGGSPCNFTVNQGDFSIIVECANKNLTDSELPKQLPLRTNHLFMEDNKLTYVDGWLENVLPQLHMVVQINFSRNRLMKLPLLPMTNNPIKHIYFENNSKEFVFDKTAFDSYLHYENLVLSFKDTRWICGCYARDLVDFMIAQTRIFSDWQVMFCAAEHEKELQRPWEIDYGHCPSREPFDYLLFLVIPLLTAVNVIFIAIFVDLRKIIWREKKGLTNHRAPWIHSIFIKITGSDWLDINIL